MANQCDYYPCHSGLFKGFSCEFCYCPEYDEKNCSGKPKWITSEKKLIKDCTECLVPHTEEYVNKYYKEKLNGSKVSSRKIVS